MKRLMSVIITTFILTQCGLGIASQPQNLRNPNGEDPKVAGAVGSALNAAIDSAAASIGTTDQEDIESKLSKFVAKKGEIAIPATILVNIKNVGRRLYRSCIVIEFIPGEKITIQHNGEIITLYMRYVPGGVYKPQDTCSFVYVGSDEEAAWRQMQQAEKEKALALAESPEAADNLANTLKDEYGLAGNNIARQFVKIITTLSTEKEIRDNVRDSNLSSVQNAIRDYRKAFPGGIVFVTEEIRKLLPSEMALLISGMEVYNTADKNDVSLLRDDLLLRSV